MWIPAHRLLHVIDKHPNPSRALQGKSCERLLREIRSGRQAFVSIRAADGLLSRLDLVHWWHLPEEQGGLADIYEDGAQYGKPAKGSTGPRPTRRRYATNEERQAARRQTYRDSHRRKVERARAATA